MSRLSRSKRWVVVVAAAFAVVSLMGDGDRAIDGDATAYYNGKQPWGVASYDGAPWL